MKLSQLSDIVNYYYPENTCLNDLLFFKNGQFQKLVKKCINVKEDVDRWTAFLAKLRQDLAFEITDLTLLNEFNPSFIAVFLINEYSRPKPTGYEPLQLVLKMSILTPVYILYFDNLVSDQNKRLFKSNPATQSEIDVFNRVSRILETEYATYADFGMQNAFVSLNDLGDISNVNPRKPYLDECIFGLYLSMHPHNINTDKLRL